jgi:succinoglycan biosynthesis transport protein ExoP
MELKQYVDALRAHWLLFAAIVLACVAGAAALAWTRTPTYAAHTQFFVSAGGVPSDPSQTYQGGLFSQQRALSYAKIVSSPPVVQTAIDQLGLHRSVQDIENEISASVPADTVLINVTVEDHSAHTAKAVADALGQRFPEFVNGLEAPSRGKASPVKVSVTSPAREPTSPESPRKPLYLALGVLLGLILGTGAVVVRDLLDNRLRDEHDVATLAGAPVLGRIIEQRKAKKRPLVMVNEPSSPEAEAYRQLRTNLRALSVDHDLRSFVVSSAVESEGKTLVVANLAVAFAQAGHRVVAVDADLRSPRLAEVFGFESSLGLSNALTGNFPVESLLQRYPGLPLEVMPSGREPANPSELLGSQRFATLLQTLTDRFEVILFDAPALLPVTDAAILAQLTSGVILVTRSATTRMSQLETAAETLRAVDKQPLGVVLNRLPARNGRAYGYSARAHSPA